MRWAIIWRWQKREGYHPKAWKSLDHDEGGKPWLDIGPAQGASSSDKERKSRKKKKWVERCVGGGRRSPWSPKHGLWLEECVCPPLGAERPGFPTHGRPALLMLPSRVWCGGGTLVLTTLWGMRWRDSFLSGVCFGARRCVWPCKEWWLGGPPGWVRSSSLHWAISFPWVTLTWWT